MVCSKMELALFSVRWIQEILVARWLENGKTLSMHDIEEFSWRYAREVEHSDDNLNALEDWLLKLMHQKAVCWRRSNPASDRLTAHFPDVC